RRAFADGIVWITAGLGVEPSKCVRQIGLALGDLPEHYVSSDVAQAHLPRLLADKNCLLIVDDVWDVAQVAPLRSALGPRGRLIITTRDAGLVSSLGAGERHVNPLGQEAALALLADWANCRVEELAVEAREVARECGGLALALALCGALAREGVPWADIREALRQQDLGFLQHRFPDYPYP